MSEKIKTPEGWVETNIGEVVDLAQGVAINAKTNYVLSDEENGIPLLKINNLLNNTIDQYANPELVPKQSIINKNDIIFTRTGQVGAVLFNKYGILHNNSFKVIPKKEIYWKYLYWFLKSERVYNYVQKVAAGSVQKDLNHSAFKTIEFKYPKNIDEQKSIADILTSFDDKIELLQAQNKTLEELAQTIFMEWFGKYNFDDDLPEGWKLKTLKDVCLKITDGTHSTVIDNPEGEFHLLSCKNIKNGQIQINVNDRKIDKNTLLQLRKRTGLSKNDLLVTTVGTIGEVALIRDEYIPYELQRSVAILRPDFSQILPEFFYQFSRSVNFQHQALSRSEGSVQTCLFLGAINGIEIIIPEFAAIMEFENIAKNIYLKIYENNSQIKTLSQTRDALLPKLMNGEIRVKN